MYRKIQDFVKMKREHAEGPAPVVQAGKPAQNTPCLGMTVAVDFGRHPPALRPQWPTFKPGPIQPTGPI